MLNDLLPGFPGYASRLGLCRSKYSPELFLEWKLHTDGALDPVLGLYQSEEQDPPLLPKLLRSTLKIYPVEEGCILNTYRAVVNDVVYTLTGRPSNVSIQAEPHREDTSIILAIAHA